MAKNKHAILLVVPGTLFWVLFAAGMATKNNAFIGAAVVLATVTIVTTLTLKVRAAGAERERERRLWQEGQPGTAKVVAISSNGSSTNRHPYVDLELDVQLADKPAYRVTTRALISQLAIPRVQPACQIQVRVDRADPHKLVVDPALTPYG